MFESDEYACESALKDYFEGEKKMNKKFEGIVERLFVNDRKTAKGNRKSISIANNKVYYGLGLHDKETYEVAGVTLKEGMTVSFEYTDGKYKNVVLETLKIVQQEVPKEVKKAMKDEDLPMRFGNAINVATFLTKSKLDIVAIAKQILPMIDDLRDKLASKYPNMTEKGVGSRCGQCVLIAAQYTANINDFIIFAEELFEEICQAEGDLKNNSVKQEVKAVENKVESKPDKLTENSANVAPPIYNEPPVVDWDENIPF